MKFCLPALLLLLALSSLVHHISGTSTVPEMPLVETISGATSNASVLESTGNIGATASTEQTSTQDLVVSDASPMAAFSSSESVAAEQGSSMLFAPGSAPGAVAMTTTTTSISASVAALPSTSPSTSPSPSPSPSVDQSTAVPTRLAGSLTANNLTDVFTDSRCVCDLHVTSCDINCCCDLNCLREELEVFTSCSDIPPQSNNPVCVDANYYIQSQTNFRTERITRGNSDLLCVYFDNYPGRTEFSSPPDVGSSDLSTLLRLFGGPGSALPAATALSYGTLYRFGDPLQSVHDMVRLSPWVLPTAQNSAFCTRGSAVGFLEDRYSSCDIHVTSLPSMCVSASVLSLDLYTANYGLLALPGAVLNSSEVVPVNLSSVVCRSAAGGARPCSTPAPTPEVAESMCLNVLTQLSFTVEHRGSEGIRRVVATAVLQDFPIDAAGTIRQTFSVQFSLFNSSLAATASSSSAHLERSGVGNYQNGRPLLAGLLVNQPDGSTSFVNVSVDPQNWFTVLSSSQSCSSAATLSLNFLQEVETACFMAPAAHTSCSALQEAAYNFLSPWNQTVSHVGRVGDADPSVLSEWVQIRNPEVLDSTLMDSSCSKIPVGVSILIFYARTGSTSQPSSQVYAVYTAYETQTVCLGAACGPIPKPIILRTRVSYVDITQNPVEVLKSVSDIQGHLPEDFFYPFFVANGSLFPASPHGFLVCLLATVCIQFMFQ